jgi:hypothetical protein
MFMGSPETLADLAVMIGWYIGPDAAGIVVGACELAWLVSSCESEGGV